MQLPVSQYTELLQKKTEKLTALLQPFNAPEIAVFDSPTSHYRMRAEFRIWHDKGDFYHIMFDQSTLQRYRVDEFPIASELINRPENLECNQSPIPTSCNSRLHLAE